MGSIFYTMVMEVPSMMILIILLSACIWNSQQLVLQHALVDHEEGAVDVDTDHQANLFKVHLQRGRRDTVGCGCNGWLDSFGHGNCKQDNWCYVDEDAGCKNMDAYYGGKWKSTTPCSNRSPSTDLLYLDSTMIVELPSFTPFTSCPVDSYPIPGVQVAVTAVLNNRLLVCGGADSGYYYQSACYSLTGRLLTGGRWTEEAGMVEWRGEVASSIWPGHGLLVTGGWNGNDYLSSTEY